MAAQEQESLCSDSVCSSPRFNDEENHHHHHHNNQQPRVRFMCSYGGRILPRPHDNQLRYVGGDTRIVAVTRTISFSLLISKLSKLCQNNVTLKYQLPNEDLDALISVTTDEDLENMMEEYDRLNRGDRASRLRLFLFEAKLENASSLGSLLEGSKREHWFLDALNGVPVLTRRRSEVSSVASEVPDYLFGLDNIEEAWDGDDRSSKIGKSRLNTQQVAEEAHSAPCSPVPTSSPYASTSSAPPSISAAMIAELAAKAQKSSLHQEDHTTTKLASSSSPESKMVKQEAVESSNEVMVPSRSPPTMKREGSGSNLSAHGDVHVPTKPPEEDRNRPLHTDEVYKPAPVMMAAQQPQMVADQYVEYTPQLVQQAQAQPPGYWMQEETSGQVYYVAAGPRPAYMPLQRMPSNVGNIAYGGDVHQGVVPVQKMAGTGSVPSSYPAKLPGKAPLYRGPTPRPVPQMMMRPPVASEYAYQQVAYEAASALPQQIYYTQKPAVMNPQYQPVMASVAVDLQTGQETNTEGSVFGRVSGSV